MMANSDPAALPHSAQTASEGTHSDATLAMAFSGSGLTGLSKEATLLGKAEVGAGQIWHMRIGSADLHSRELPQNFNASFCYYVLFMIEGETEVWQWRLSRTLGPGDIVPIYSWLPHHLSVADNAELIIVTLPVWWALREVLNETILGAQNHIPADFIGAGALHRLVADLINVPIEKDIGDKALLMLAALLRNSLEILAAQGDHLPSIAGRMGRLMKLITANAGQEGFSPREAAIQLKCSLRTVHQTCSDHGTTFNTLLIDARLNLAASLLASTDERISEIAYSCGFASLSHFCRMFKAHFGVVASRVRGRDRRDRAGPGANHAGASKTIV
ncbi:MAG TPA: AraC family transcriptional regulator [Burkholderiales bacterium]|uniref:helix-turn-helix transcriptional regulator n=1 Tax=Sphingobium sp. TaxID=1912891 RepID=UPI002ED22C70